LLGKELHFILIPFKSIVNGVSKPALKN